MYARIVGKYCCQELANFILNINDFAREFMPITGGGSLEEWACHFDLPEQGITLKGLLRFLNDRCCIEINRKENLVRLRHDNLFKLHLKLSKKLQKERLE